MSGCWVADACILVQRTTAKEQARRLIAAELPSEFVHQHRGVVVENHLQHGLPLYFTQGCTGCRGGDSQ